MKKVFNLMIGRHSIITVVAILGILDILLIASIIVPPILTFLKDKHLFEIVVLTTLVEILLLLSYNLWHPTPLAFGSETEAQEKIRALLKEDSTIKSVKILSAGLSSRAQFLRDLIEKFSKSRFEIVACFGKGSPNPDELDRENLGPTQFNIITHRLKPDEEARLKIYESFNIPSFRCILLSDSRGPRYGFVGWYTYQNRSKNIVGRSNIQIFADRTTDLGVDLLHFSEKMFKYYSSEEESKILFPLEGISEF
jgi:hypothetical protein